MGSGMWNPEPYRHNHVDNPPISTAPNIIAIPIIMIIIIGAFYL